jgi:hypothetical protein
MGHREALVSIVLGFNEADPGAMGVMIKFDTRFGAAPSPYASKSQIKTGIAFREAALTLSWN